jgi:ActR/RegA family two-component response regulator
MEWRAKVKLFEEIRREHEFGVGTISGIAHKLGMHRRMVRKTLADARPARAEASEAAGRARDSIH